ncbi:TPA: hypothetical protein I7709_01315 [Vibrio vulnificus]|nr:hypothetical protein [Vibrio vulnificus]RZP82315.1 hypothetical protein D8T60_01880 [Vibrio vulnificus]RZQ31218.1 hypothetical protein D8T36_01025 [Vibrio vulnificus]RZQ36264.1 hypothetical protein D8T38_11480 [Vibrio vulnificus]RZQ80366.1 hypothetical protein D8T22_02190 [Vibrio vulnificus]
MLNGESQLSTAVIAEKATALRLLGVVALFLEKIDEKEMDSWRINKLVGVCSTGCTRRRWRG